MPRYPVGKLPHRQLERLLQRFAPTDRPDVLIGPRVGQDAAVLRLPPRRRSSPGQWTLVAATDPVTFTAERIGWYAVQINANDVAVMGATPRWFLACLLLPQRWPHRPARIFDDIATACRELHVAAVGGHTEVTAGLDRPIVIGQMLGLARTDCIVHADRARPGQAIIMTKSAAIEATAIIARQHARRLA
ncbi:MAG: AIR synthase related protein, partial [Phycisphaerae bacterium]